MAATTDCKENKQCNDPPANGKKSELWRLLFAAEHLKFHESDDTTLPPPPPPPARQQDQTGESSTAIKVPTKFDILLGRDKASFRHVGNQHFRVIVGMHRERYQSCKSREEKGRVTSQVIRSIKESGGRFLRKNEETGYYEAANDEVAHEKVSHALRSAKDPTKKLPRKRKRSSTKPPTPEDEERYQFIMREQQKILQELLQEQDAFEVRGVPNMETMTASVKV